MPIFEYQCEECGASFERLTLSSQSVVSITCPQCCSAQTVKIFSTFSTTAGSRTAVGNTGNPTFS